LFTLSLLLDFGNAARGQLSADESAAMPAQTAAAASAQAEQAPLNQDATEQAPDEVLSQTPLALAAPSSEDPLPRHEAEFEQLQSRLAELRATIANNREYRSALLEELRQFEQDIDALAAANHQLALMASEQRQAAAATAERLSAVEIELQEARAALAELVRAAYAMGRGDQLRLLLGQDDPRRSERLLGYYQVVADRRAARVDKIHALEDELQVLEQQQRDEAVRLARLAERQVQTQERLATASRAQQAVLADLEQTIAADQARASALTADAEALQALIEQVKRQAEIADEVAISPGLISDLRGQLHWPLANARLLRRFGEGREQGALHADGVLLAAQPGAEVAAIHHGRVAYADWLRGFGMLMVIDHGGGYLSLYGHNQALLKETGEWVATGDLIALAGRSGGAGQNSLYFAIRRQGRAVDPAPWCRSTDAGQPRPIGRS
jgi:septal ring factor EnvC (AmiA/AmiB activator)